MAVRKKPDTRASINSRQAKLIPIDHSGFYPYYRQFLQHTEVHCSAGTAKTRESALRRFIVWCDERDLDRPHDITRPILERYKRHLFYYRKSDGHPLSRGFQVTMLTPLRAFFKWLCKENHILYNPASELDLPKVPKHLPKTVLHAEDINQVIGLIDITTINGIRDRAIIETLYNTGMRRMELVNLTAYDIDYRRGVAWIRKGKGQKDRLVPMGETTLNWIERYQDHARAELVIEPDNDALFINDYGESLSCSQLSALVKRYLKRADIQTTGSCHLLRHACATHMLENGADIRFIQQLLGHENLSTTEIYTQVSIDKLKAIHAATHPGNKKAGQA